MKKIIKILIFLICIGIFINITLSMYVKKESNIALKIGNVWTGGQISTYNYSAISRNFEYYLNYLEKEDYENAYKLTPYEYKQYKKYDMFVEDVKKINYAEAQIINITRRTEKMYSVMFSTVSNEKIENLITFNDDNTAFTITPETFLEYKEFNKKIKKKNVRYELISTLNYVDKYIANIRITNLSSKENVTVPKIELIQSSTKSISRKYK